MTSNCFKNKYLVITLLSTALISASIMANAKNSLSLINKPTRALQRIVVPKTNYEVRMGLGEMAPNAIKSHRIQSGPEMVYVLQGELILKIDGQPEKIIKSGESFQLLANVPHETKAGPIGAKFFATWVVEQGKDDSFVVPIK